MKQVIVSRSSTKVEYRCLDSATIEVTLLQALPIIRYDDTSVVDLTANLIFYSKTKHIELDCHFVGKKCLKSG